MKVCILGASLLLLNSNFCFELEGDKNDLESSISSNTEEKPDTRVDNALLKQLLEKVEHVEEENRYLLSLVHHLESENVNRKKEIDELNDELLSQKEYTNGLEELIVEIVNSNQCVAITGHNKLFLFGDQKTLLKDTRKSPSLVRASLSSQGISFCI